MGTNEINNPTVVFTAPADGYYSYSEVVTAAAFTDAQGAAIAAKATVRVNGEVVATFSPTADDPTKTLTGTVELNAGDLLMFAFELTTTGNDIADYTQVIKLGATSVTAVEAPTGGDDSGAGNQQGGTTNPPTSDTVIASVVIAAVALIGIAYVSKKH